MYGTDQNRSGHIAFKDITLTTFKCGASTGGSSSNWTPYVTAIGY